MTERLLADNLLAQVAYAKAVIAADPEARWASINANHMLPAGSSLFIPPAGSRRFPADDASANARRGTG